MYLVNKLSHTHTHSYGTTENARPENYGESRHNCGSLELDELENDGQSRSRISDCAENDKQTRNNFSRLSFFDIRWLPISGLGNYR